MSELVQKLIAENLESKNPVLDLGNCGLDGTEKKLYQALQEADHLKTLIFSNQYWDYEKKAFHKSKNEGEKNCLDQIPENLPLHLEKLIVAGEAGNRWQIQNISSIISLKYLQELNLHGNRVQDLKPLQELKALKKLDLSDNHQIEDISFLKNLEQLQSLNLNLGEDYEEVPYFLGALKNLRVLDISSSRLENISFLKDLKALEVLDLSLNGIEDFYVLANLEKLQDLNLYANYNYGRKGKGLETLKNLQQLKNLNLSDIQIQDITFLESLHRLEKLELHHNEITEVTPLQGLANLKILGLVINRIEDITALQTLKNLEELYLNSNEIKDITALKKLQNLRVLYIKYNLIEDHSLLKNLENLETLEMDIDNFEFPPIWYAYLSAKRGKMSDCKELSELPQVKKVWQLMQATDEKNNALAQQLAEGQGWTEEDIEMYEGLLNVN